MATAIAALVERRRNSRGFSTLAMLAGLALACALAVGCDTHYQAFRKVTKSYYIQDPGFLEVSCAKDCLFHMPSGTAGDAATSYVLECNHLCSTQPPPRLVYYEQNELQDLYDGGQ